MDKNILLLSPHISLRHLEYMKQENRGPRVIMIVLMVTSDARVGGCMCDDSLIHMIHPHPQDMHLIVSVLLILLLIMHQGHR
jgi:hypothetical protein